MILTHGCWVAVAIGAFWIGEARQVSSPNTDQLTISAALEDASSATFVENKSLLENATKTAEDQKKMGLVSDTPSLMALSDKAIRDPNPITRRLAFSRLLEALTPDNAVEIREQLLALGAEGDQWRDFNYQWGAVAGEEAFRFAASSEEKDLDAALAGWASANPSKALAMLDNLPEELQGQRDSLARSVVEGVSDRDLASATDLVLRLASEGVLKTDELMGIVANDAVRMQGVENAAKWSESLPNGPLKGAAMQRIAGDYAERDPEGAAAWAEGITDQDSSTRVIQEVSNTWAARNPVASVNWLESLPEGNGQKAGLRSVFGDWEDRDPAAATEYLASMPESAQRDSAISGFSRGYAWQDPEVAIAWALDISDPALRQDSLTRAGQVFLRRDADSARAWLDSSGLPTETREAILKPRG